MSEKKMLFLVNPKAGKAKIKNHFFNIIDIFTKGGYVVTTYITQSREDAMRMAREHNGSYDMIVCSGGDGTLDEVVTGMVKSGKSIPIGYIPAGSTNDFANSLHLPKRMEAAAQMIMDGKLFPCDIGAFNKDIFVYVAAFGLFTDVSYGTEQEMKNMFRHIFPLIPLYTSILH